MKKRIPIVLLALLVIAAQAFAQQRIISGKVTSEQGTPLAGVLVAVKGTIARTETNHEGQYSIRAEAGQVLQFSYIGTAMVERVVAADDVISVELRRAALDLGAVVVTALGQTATQGSLGYAQQSVPGAAIAQTQRPNFINALQGRVAGLDVTSTSGVPGSSSSITIRGVTSNSSSNQPLIIVDGLPMDNRTLNTGVLASDANSNTAFSNRGVDFTNRAADLNPDDIGTLTVLKGPEAAALYGIDAANGAIVITTKRGRVGGGVQYTSTFRVERTTARYQLQRVYGPTTLSGGLLGSFQYFGAPYAAGTAFYDNIDGFLKTGTTATTSLSFSGATSDNRINYRLGTAVDKQTGVVPKSGYSRLNLTASSQAQVSRWLQSDVSMSYTYDNNDQVYKGDLGPLIDLMVWPQTDDARNYLTPSGLRRRLTGLTAASEVDNPYYNVQRNKLNAKTNRIIANLGFLATPWRTRRTSIEQRRLVRVLGQAVPSHRDFWYLTLTRRHDWPSTSPARRNSFFYASVSTRFVLSDAFPGVRRFVTGKGRDAY